MFILNGFVLDCIDASFLVVLLEYMSYSVILYISGSRDLNRLYVVHEAVIDDVYAHIVVDDLVAAA